MRRVCAVAVTVLLSACASQPEVTSCPETRPEVCTLEYRPTCAVRLDGSWKEYSSPCNACADDQVSGVMSGPCPE